MFCAKFFEIGTVVLDPRRRLLKIVNMFSLYRSYLSLKWTCPCISTNFIAFFPRVAFGQTWLKLTSGYAENFRCQLVFIISILFSFGNKRVLSIEQTKFFLLSLSLLSHFIGSNTGYRIWNTIQKTVQYINLPLTTIIFGKSIITIFPSN